MIEIKAGFGLLLFFVWYIYYINKQIQKNLIKTTLKFCQISCNFAQLCIRFTHLDTVYKTDLEGTYNYSSTIYKSLPQGTLFLYNYNNDIWIAYRFNSEGEILGEISFFFLPLVLLWFISKGQI